MASSSAATRLTSDLEIPSIPMALGVVLLPTVMTAKGAI